MQVLQVLLKRLSFKGFSNKKIVILSPCYQFYASNNNNNDGNYRRDRFTFKNNMKSILFGTSVVTFMGFITFKYKLHEAFKIKENLAFGIIDETDVGNVKSNLPYYTLHEISQHDTMEKRVWVTYKEGVYDITDFIIKHPGGDQILLAAGNSIAPFWSLYAVHKNAQVYEILESLRIGNLTKADSEEHSYSSADPYSTDPKRHPVLKPASVKPFNAESPPILLVQNFLTPNELFYVRNHLPVPEIDADTYELEVEVEETEKVIKLTLDELQKLPKCTITATIMCAGNRRSEMMEIKPVKGLSWGAAAVGNAKFTGVRLRDILKMAGVDEDNPKFKHVQFEGIDLDATGKQYGASIPFWKAMDKKADVLLAYEMNDAPLPRDHGYPVRVVVPGVVGARCVKWLGKVLVSAKESDSHWQQNDYKGFSPSTDWDTVDFRKSPAIQELPVISAICQPAQGDAASVEDGCVTVKGYAWSGGGQRIVRVDVTADGGDSWHVADLVQAESEPPQHWSWTLWTCKVPVDGSKKEVEFWAKAVDSCYNTQPESFKNIWNLRGVLSNAYHRVAVKLL